MQDDAWKAFRMSKNKRVICHGHKGSFPKDLYVFVIFLCFVSGLVFPVGGLLLKLMILRWFRAFSLHHNQHLASIVSKS